MDILTDSRHVSRLEVVETGRRRRWSKAEKLRVVEESLAGPRLASATARRHGISNQLLFSWRKAYREGWLGEVAGFVPAEVVSERVDRNEGPGCGRIEVVVASGRRIIVDWRLMSGFWSGLYVRWSSLDDPDPDGGACVAGDRPYRHALRLSEPGSTRARSPQT